MTNICVGNLPIIGSDNGLAPGQYQAIIWTNAGILLIRSLGTNFSEILSKIHAFSFKKMHLKTSSAKWRPSCLSLNVFMLFPSFAVYQSPRVGREKQVVDYREWIPGTSAQTNGEVSNTFLFPYTTCIYLLLSLHVNTMAADDLATQGARASTVMVLTMTRCHVCVWCKSLHEVAVLYTY